MSQSKPRLIKHEDGMLECPCGHFPIGNTNLMYEMEITNNRNGRIICRAYYKCFICNREFDLKKVEGTGHWDYQDEEDDGKEVVDMTEEFDLKMRRGNTLYCPKCGKKAPTFMRPSDHRMADYRLECKCTSLKCYVIYKY